MSPVAFIIGAGPGVGITVARRFAKEGYKVAIASRNPDVDAAKKEGLFAVKLDASDAASITAAFEKVEKELGLSNVVVWNGWFQLHLGCCVLESHVNQLFIAGNDSPLPVKGDALSLSVEEWQTGISSATNFFVIAKHAVEGFRKISSGPKVLISTGNIGPWMAPWTDFFAIQVQKKLIAALVEDFVSRYEKDGQRYADLMFIASECKYLN
jgi:NAD(P)-dependent dehydrogenase (short-subunit alcohol dehydrogenase family)